MSIKIATLILAAGSSSRFGENKFLTKLGTLNLIERTLLPFVFLKELCNHVMVVTGYYSNELRPLLNKYRVKQIHNPSFNLGMSSSIQVGIEFLKKELNTFSGIIVHLGDIPLITISDLELIISSHKQSQNKIIIPKFNHKRGHPILIPKILFSDLRAIKEETQGLRGLITNNDNSIEYVKVDNDGILTDIDTKEDVNKLSRLS